MKKIKRVCVILKFMGLKWALFRVIYALKLKAGFFEKKYPLKPWEYYSSNAVITGAPSLAGLAAALCIDKKNVIARSAAMGSADGVRRTFEEADRVCDGAFTFYSCQIKELGEFPEWDKNYVSGEKLSAKSHWSKMPWNAAGDIKNVWELSRFSWAFALARAFALTSEPERKARYAARFWALLNNWMENNPPDCGANWMCGQETAMRLMAALFAASVFAAHGAYTKDDETRFVRFAAASAARIDENISYALSQKNNHGVSESAGLFAAGVLFTWLKRASAYKERAARCLEAQVQELFYADGAFAQYSLNYHRVALDGLMFALFAAAAAEYQAPHAWADALERSEAFFAPLINPQSGEVPNYGSNDGARLLQLASADYGDFRPTAAALCAYLKKPLRVYSAEALEEAAWLWGEEPKLCKSCTRGELRAEKTGYYSMQGGDFFGFLRCGHYFHRMHHEDTLSLWLEYKGARLAVDAGSYSYASDFCAKLLPACALRHNVLTADNLPYSEAVSKFLHLPAPCGEPLFNWEFGGSRIFVGKSLAYARLNNKVDIYRAVILRKDFAAVIDYAECDIERTYAVSWLLDAEDAIINLAAASKIRLKAGHELFMKVCASSALEASKDFANRDNGAGWASYAYNELTPSLSLKYALKPARAGWFCTVFSENRVELAQEGDAVKISNAEICVRVYPEKLGLAADAPLSEIFETMTL